MGFLKSVTAQLRPVPDVLDSEEVHEMPHAALTTTADDKNDANVDVELQKPDFNPQPSVEAGVARVEAVQAVWGKRGRYLIIAG